MTKSAIMIFFILCLLDALLIDSLLHLLNDFEFTPKIYHNNPGYSPLMLILDALTSCQGLLFQVQSDLSERAYNKLG